MAVNRELHTAWKQFFSEGEMFQFEGNSRSDRYQAPSTHHAL